jgi:hypothetical protein
MSIQRYFISLEICPVEQYFSLLEANPNKTDVLGPVVSKAFSLNGG